MSRSPSQRPKKYWGQHFLRNPGAVEKIVAALEVRPGELILEIGPGEGVLTGSLAALGHPLVAVEIDPGLVARLRSRFSGEVEIVHEDATVVAFPRQPFVAVGNLPYNVGTPILRRIVAHPQCRRAVFMVQKEVARRIVAEPGSKDYGYLTLAVRLHADARILLNLPPGSFHPPPKVWSSVVVLNPVPRNLACPEEDLDALIGAAFGKRRKKLLNAIEGFRGLEREELARRIRQAGFSEDVRAEQLSLEEFDRLCATL
ncbi:MAG TPA: 16S rRNA (adenine(1518)-N(6)/adenine(1519)-N(6))-dimethyltransferase RsmA [Thermoanaerobaculia bacterium]|nr:16S rRNA (adenine(1518)-N(6)/adenine(1519)-N(6))-dimethyltransferase RsmA [Thermoanaerobaculia bacterium]